MNAFSKVIFLALHVMLECFKVEAMAQVGGVLVLNTVPDPENYLIFMKIDNVKFKHPVHPGDHIVFKLRVNHANSKRDLS